MSKLLLKKLDRQSARLRQQIGAGCFYPYLLGGEPGVLRLQLADDCLPGEMSDWRCEAGNLRLSDAQAALSLMSATPTFALPATAPEQLWYWPWWQSQLSGELLTLFGHISVTEEQTAAEFLLLMTLEWGGEQARSLLALSAQTLARLLDKPGWRQEKMPLPAALPLSLPVIIGELMLSPGELKRGDVLLPQRPCFTPDGRGAIRCAGCLLHGELRIQSGTTAHFYLSEMENHDVTLPPDEFEQQITPDPQWETGSTAEAADYSALPLALSVRCGQLRLTLGELSGLAPGATVMIDNVTPGEALLCHGDYPLAKGELVEVEGRLGLQITHMLPSHSPLAP
ncbi:FliM/FliN family flagellar motor switch protein [Kalamiella sp. sgz302252]|uniref:FliM/FliN family flagellar motor switch protein n=1 Tax=Pantoea sp. sgz302252 TaxID=3341827 RepID=UPI0036D348AE